MTDIDLTRTFYHVAKRQMKCVICRSPNDIDMHHVKPAEKVNTVYALSYSGDIASLVVEFKKCIPICRPHHKDVHMGRFTGWMDGKFDNGKLSSGYKAAKYMPYISRVPLDLSFFSAEEKKAISDMGLIVK